MTRVVHYINQFFAGIGGEEKAWVPAGWVDGPLGPGRRLATLLGPDFEIVGTVFCGDDYAAQNGDGDGVGVMEQIVTLAAGAKPDLVVAGPAFGSGRYGLACARVAAAATAAGIAAVAAMHEDNPGVEDAGAVPVVAAGPTARDMKASLERLAGAARTVAAGGVLTAADGRVGPVPRRGTMAEAPAAVRAVDLLLARLAGDRERSEVPLPRFDRVTPAPPVADPGAVTVALVTEGALVPDDNPDRLESARATRWQRYSLDGLEALQPGSWRSVHGGFSTQWANEDPHRILPLDAARDLERAGAIGRLGSEYLVTAGNGTPVGTARRFGVEWAADLRRSGARAAILTAT